MTSCFPGFTLNFYPEATFGQFKTKSISVLLWAALQQLQHMQLHRFETRKFKLLFQLNCAESSIGTPLMCAVWTNTEKEADGKYGITTDQSQSTLLCIFTCFTRKQYKVTSRQKQSFGNMIKAMNIRCGHAVQSV